MSKQYKAGFVGVVGMPNAGKSSLVNKLVRQKIAIVTAKPQTTRNKVAAIHTDEHCQIIFMDSPGLIKAERGLNRFLEEEVDKIIDESDILLAVISLSEKKQEHIDEVLKRVVDSGKKWIGIINKTDQAELVRRIPIIQAKLEAENVEVILTNQNMNNEELILEKIRELLPDSEAALYDTSIMTTETERRLSEEFIREACFNNLRSEVPYGIAVQIIVYDETSKIPKLHANVIVNRESHKPIVVGKGARTIKKIGSESRAAIEKMIGQKIYLELNVIARPSWDTNKNLMKEYGYAHR